tara:strand:+ start:1880 stop:2038 length:159 start_codon:yes stop_codon:yes gene_type:complete
MKKLTAEEINFLKETLETMLKGYEEEKKDFDSEDYYAENEINLTKEILTKIK